MIDGLLVVDKPAGWTSHDVVAKLRGATRQRRIGHAGTLDPDATGVLLVGLGRVTRLMRFLQETTKSYRGVVAFGVATSTLDAAGEELARREMPEIDEAAVRAATLPFLGDIEQVPPMVSAIKIGGQRLHELARQGKEIDRPPRPVRIDRFDIEDFTPGPFPVATVLVDCSSGTYIRTLAADLGEALGGFAHLASLRRLRVGAFTLDDATPLDVLVEEPAPYVLTPADALRGMRTLTVDDAIAAAIANGKVFDGATVAAEGVGPFAMLDAAGTLLAVYEWKGSRLKPSVVIPATDPPAGGADQPAHGEETARE
ncbi:MAG: tRNA pseudouridine(55) synthase TruB [Acidimicrobiia bacterium]|nr:tRNA pseudouridine(55) synthase TruB [Acidimicrobiia bacterium]